MNQELKTTIKTIIRDCILNKLNNYQAKDNYMPFHYLLIGEKRMAYYSFVHSLNTSLGSKVFEQIAFNLANSNKDKFKKVQRQYEVGSEISISAQNEIQAIIDELSQTSESDKNAEIERIRIACQAGNQTTSSKMTKVDLYIETKDGEIYLFDLKGSTPNINTAKIIKRNLLEWTAVMLTQDIGLNIHSCIAIPYNRYKSQKYNPWTLKILDLKNEVKVGEEFWDYLGGEGTYESLLDCFKEVGQDNAKEINKYFQGNVHF